jgi:multidrug efflux system membrane fusion protein
MPPKPLNSMNQKHQIREVSASERLCSALPDPLSGSEIAPKRLCIGQKAVPIGTLPRETRPQIDTLGLTPIPVQNRKSILITALLATLPVACNRAPEVTPPPPPATVRAISATTADVPLEIAAIGNVEAISSVDVKARLTAPVLQVHFSEGQDVKQGQILFSLDAEPVNRQLTEIEANIAKDLATEKQAEANLARDQVTANNLNSIATRSAGLLKDGILSREQADQAAANAEAAKAALEADRAALESARAAEKANRARLHQIRLQLDYTKVYAPITGRAGSIAIKQGGLARENDNTLVTILQTTPIYVSFPVPENLLPQIRRYNASKPLAITATSADSKIAIGTLQFIDNSVDTTTGTIRLKASFNNAERALWPGQFVNVRARLSVEQNRIVISSQTVQTGPQGKYVWVLNPADSTVSIRLVKVLRIYTPAGDTEKAVIGEGLKQGESVISEGQLRLAPGAKVRLLASPTQTFKPAPHHSSQGFLCVFASSRERTPPQSTPTSRESRS